jgi:hypothetical protein
MTLWRPSLIGVAWFAMLPCAFAQQEKTPEKYPPYFKLYSSDGRENLTVSCRPTDGFRPEVNKISCEFMHVRFQQSPPDDNPMAVIDKLKVISQKEGKDPKAIDLELATVRTAACSEYRKAMSNRPDLGGLPNVC